MLQLKVPRILVQHATAGKHVHLGCAPSRPNAQAQHAALAASHRRVCKRILVDIFSHFALRSLFYAVLYGVQGKGTSAVDGAALLLGVIQHLIGRRLRGGSPRVGWVFYPHNIITGMSGSTVVMSRRKFSSLLYLRLEVARVWKKCLQLKQFTFLVLHSSNADAYHDALWRRV